MKTDKECINAGSLSKYEDIDDYDDNVSCKYRRNLRKISKNCPETNTGKLNPSAKPIQNSDSKIYNNKTERKGISKNIKQGDLVYLNCKFKIFLNFKEIAEHQNKLKYISEKDITHKLNGNEYIINRLKYTLMFPHASGRIYYLVLNSQLNFNTLKRHPDAFIKLNHYDYPIMCRMNSPNGYISTDSILLHEVSLPCLNLMIKSKNGLTVGGNHLYAYNYGNVNNISVYEAIYNKITSPSHNFLLKSSSKEAIGCVLKSIEDIIALPSDMRKSNEILDSLSKSSLLLKQDVIRRTILAREKQEVLMR